MPSGIIIMHHSDVANPDRQHIHMKERMQENFDRRKEEIIAASIYVMKSTVVQTLITHAIDKIR